MSQANVFTAFNTATDVAANQQAVVTNGLFTGNSPSLQAMYTSSLQSSGSKVYYYEVWDGDQATSADAEPQFSIAYGNKKGSGSLVNLSSNDTPSRAIYSQYKQLVLADGDTDITFPNASNNGSVYIINFNRARIKDRLDQGNWQIKLGNIKTVTGSGINPDTCTYSGSSVLTLIDDSNDEGSTPSDFGKGRIYQVVSGTIAGGRYTGDTGSFGLCYPDLGVLILNADRLDTVLGFKTNTGSLKNGDNAWKLYTSLSGSIAANKNAGNIGDRGMIARNAELITSTNYFVRVNNKSYNYSSNPSYITGSDASIKLTDFRVDPKSYITTIGLYNAQNDLLATAKLSKPILKSFSSEVLIKVKLDF